MKSLHWVVPGILSAWLAWWITPRPGGRQDTRPPGGKHPPAAEESQRVSNWQAAIRNMGNNRWDSMRGAVELAKSIPAGERMNWLQTGRFHHRDPLVVEVFMSELARLAFDESPAAFIASEINRKPQRFREYLSEMAAADPHSVIKLAEDMENAEVRCACYKEAAIVLAERDPDALFKLIPRMSKADVELLQVLKTAARGDAERLLTAADTAGDSWKQLLSASAMLVKAENNMTEALAWMAADEHGTELFRFLRDWNDVAWPIRDSQKRFIEKLIAAMNQMPAGWLESFHDNDRIMSGLRIVAPEACLELDMMRLGVSQRENDSIKEEIYCRCVGFNPARIAALYQKDTSLEDATRKRIVLGWATTWRHKEMPAELRAVIDPAVLADAEAVVARKPEPAVKPPKPSITEQLNRGLQDRGSWGLSLPSELTFAPTPETAAEAEAWARSLPDEQIKNASNRACRTGYVPPGLSDIIFSRAFKLGVMSDKNIREWTSDMSNRAYQNPAEAARCLAAYPEGWPRDLALQNIALRWNELDPKDAATWIHRLPERDRKIAADAIAKGEVWQREQQQDAHAK